MKLPDDSLDRVASSFDSLLLGDPRRTERLMLTVRRLAESPRSSIPEAMGSEAELEGAYRLLHNKHVTLEKLTAAYGDATAARAREAECVLAIHDTTTCEFSHASPEDVGYLSTGKAGFMAHYSLVVAADGSRRPFGVAHVEALFRSRPPSRPSAKGRKERNVCGPNSAKNPERESLRWLRGFILASERLKDCAVVHIADREGDSYGLFGGAIQRQLRFVIRARLGDRRARLKDGSQGTVKELARASEGVLTREVMLSRRNASSAPREKKGHPPRDARVAQLSFSATTVEIQKPSYLDSLPETVTLNMVHVHEEHAPDGEDPIEWLLFTTEPVATSADIEAVVDMYRTRWLIEECNKALKTGCRYEDRQLESREALLNLLAMTLPIACELLWLRSSCRANPGQPASQVLTCVQLQILHALGSYKLPSEPTVHDALWAVASLGGHIRSNGEPGWLILHRGMAKLLAYEEGWLARKKLAGLPISR
jgi:Transposase DNA-binding/Transposase DDE domain